MSAMTHEKALEIISRNNAQHHQYGETEEYREADKFLSAFEEGVGKTIGLIDEAIEDESHHADERGHGQSLHLGAMDALRSARENILALLVKK